MSTHASGTSALLRWRPALIALTAAAAGLSIYYLRAAEESRAGNEDRNAPGLRRSNAIRRRSPRLRPARASIAGDRATGPEAAVDGGGGTAGGAGGGEGSTPWESGQNTHVASDDDEDDDGFDPSGYGSYGSPEGGQSLLNLLYHIAEEQARMEGYVHRGVTCNSCNLMPIRGIRYRCANCPDYDLCETCEQLGVHDKTHLFYKIRIPAPFLGNNPRNQQPVWYPGRPFGLPRMVPKELKSKLSEATGFEKSRIDALWEQFKSLADVDWPGDPSGLKVAIDRKIWAKYCMPTMLREHEPASTLVFDQSFTFYDDNDDGLVGFAEFLEGLAAKQSKDQNEKLRRIFRAHDLDRDGYVEREDFMKLFASNYAFTRELSKDLFQMMYEEVLDDRSLREALRGTQPVSSCFTGTIPNGDPSRTGEGKTMSSTGDWVVTDGGGFLRQADDGLVEAEDVDDPISSAEGQQSQAEDNQVERDGQDQSIVADLFQDLDRSDVWPPSFVTLDDVRAALNRDVPVSAVRGAEARQQVIAAAHGRMERDNTDDHSSETAARTATEVVGKASKLSDSSASLQSNTESTSNEPIHGHVTPRTDSDMDLGHMGYSSAPVKKSNFAREFLYLQTREGFEEVLDPMFKQLEDLNELYLRSSNERRRLRRHIDDFRKQDSNETICQIWLSRLLRQWRKGEHKGSNLYDDKMAEEMIRQLVKETEVASDEWMTNVLDRICSGFLSEEQLTDELARLAGPDGPSHPAYLIRRIRHAWLTAKRGEEPHPDHIDDYLDSLEEQMQAKLGTEESSSEDVAPADEAPVDDDDDGDDDVIVIDRQLVDDYLTNPDVNDFHDQAVPETLRGSSSGQAEQIQEPATSSDNLVQAFRVGDDENADNAEANTFDELSADLDGLRIEHAGIQTLHMPDGSDSTENQLQSALARFRRAHEDPGSLPDWLRNMTDEQWSEMAESFNATFGGVAGDLMADEANEADVMDIVNAADTVDEMEYEPVVDPTLPQNRPNTDESAAGGSIPPFTHTRAQPSRRTRERPQRSVRWPPVHQIGTVASMEEQNAFEDPSDDYFKVKIKYLALLEMLTEEHDRRGGVARLNAEEFEQIMLGSKGQRLETIGKWLDLAAF